MLSSHIFRAYDIRGIVDTDFDEMGAEKIGKAYATYLMRTDGISVPRICVGRDGRNSGERIKNAFIAGVVSCGAQVTDIGLSTSPLLFYSTCRGGFDGGVNITASHNSREYNGFKLQRKDAHAICGDEIQSILNICLSEDFETKEEGKEEKKEDGFLQEYFSTLEELVSISGKPKIVFDAGNGVAGMYIEELFTRLGCEVIPLYCEVDGNFPNHDADPEVEENLADLKKTVRDTSADLGVAFDGDGDRVGIVDANGVSYAADLLLLLLSRDLLTRHKNAKIVIDLKATQVLFDEITRSGGEGIMVQTGHSFVEQKMQEVGSLLGGEVSGHIFIGENYYGFDDAFLAAAKIIEILQNHKKPLAQHFIDLPKVYTTPEIKISCSEQHKFQVVNQVRDIFIQKYSPKQCILIDGIRIDFGNGAWGILRASNTSPKVTLRFEARTQEQREEIQSEMIEVLKEVMKNIQDKK